MVKKTMYKILVILFLLYGCSSNHQVPQIDESKRVIPEGDNIIPFEYISGISWYMPVLRVKTKENTELLLLFDSGAVNPVLYDSGAVKILGSKEKVDEAISSVYQDYYGKELIEKEKNEQLKELFKTKNIVLPIDKLIIESFEKELCKFYYAPDKYRIGSPKGIDGMIGIDFFSDCTRLLIDYKNCYFELNGERLPVGGISMHKKTFLGLYEIPVVIDGLIDTAIIDTGAEGLVLRPDYGKVKPYMSDEEIKEFIFQNKPKLTIKSKTKISQITIGKETWYNLYGHFGSRIYPPLPYTTRNLALLDNVIGYPFFENNRIQFDFSKKEFLIERTE